jgi:hypothetical protein
MCPRCGAQLAQTYATEFPGCVVCGFENYTHVLPKRQRMQGALSSKLRYIGFADKLEGVTVPVRVKRDQSKAGIAMVPSCPWDGRDMRIVASSSYGRVKNERTYRCSKRHRIILLGSVNGEWRGWM